MVEDLEEMGFRVFLHTLHIEEKPHEPVVLSFLGHYHHINSSYWIMDPNKIMNGVVEVHLKQEQLLLQLDCRGS